MGSDRAASVSRLHVSWSECGGFPNGRTSGVPAPAGLTVPGLPLGGAQTPGWNWPAHTPLPAAAAGRRGALSRGGSPASGGPLPCPHGLVSGRELGERVSAAVPPAPCVGSPRARAWARCGQASLGGVRGASARPEMRAQAGRRAVPAWRTPAAWSSRPAPPGPGTRVCPPQAAAVLPRLWGTTSTPAHPGRWSRASAAVHSCLGPGACGGCGFSCGGSAAPAARPSLPPEVRRGHPRGMLARAEAETRVVFSASLRGRPRRPPGQPVCVAAPLLRARRCDLGPVRGARGLAARPPRPWFPLPLCESRETGSPLRAPLRRGDQCAPRGQDGAAAGHPRLWAGGPVGRPQQVCGRSLHPHPWCSGASKGLVWREGGARAQGDGDRDDTAGGGDGDGRSHLWSPLPAPTPVTRSHPVCGGGGGLPCWRARRPLLGEVGVATPPPPPRAQRKQDGSPGAAAGPRVGALPSTWRAAPGASEAGRGRAGARQSCSRGSGFPILGNSGLGVHENSPDFFYLLLFSTVFFKKKFHIYF